jgi:hypothetical protein
MIAAAALARGDLPFSRAGNSRHDADKKPGRKQCPKAQGKIAAITGVAGGIAHAPA